MSLPSLMHFASSILCTLLLVAAAQAAPVTQPTTLPADDLPQVEQVREWLVGLADPDPAIRDESRYELMGLAWADLPALRIAAERYRPLDRSVLENLRDIVTHVYLTEYPVPSQTEEGFLGISLPATADLPDDPRLLIVIDGRMRGFCAYRALRDGDVILDIDEAPLPARATAPVVILRSFTEAIRRFPQGRTVHLRVLRQGKVLRVPVKLDGRPAAAQGMELTLDDMILTRNRRERAAQEYWEAEFEPYVAGKAAPAGSY